MGWNPFKSKKKTSVDTAVMRVVEDDNLPETIQQSVLRSVLRETDIRTELLTGMIEGMVPKFDRMFAYAKDHYPHGLPDVTMLADSNGQQVVKNVIQTEQNRTITFDYFYFGPLSVSHYARAELMRLYGYNPQTNELVTLSQQRGTQVYVKDITALYTQATANAADAGTLASWGPPASGGVSPSRPLNNLIGQFSEQTPYEIVPGRTQDGIRVEYEWRLGGVVRSASLTFNLVASVLDSSYFQVQYHWTAGNTYHYRYWTYLQGSNTYPAIEQIHDPRYSRQGTYFPFIFFRNYKTNMTGKDEEDTALFKASSKMMDLLGMDYQSIGEDIHANPDVNDIEQAVMWMGVPITSRDPEACRYLFQYFRRIFFLQVGLGRSSQQAINIRDADFALNISYDGLRYRRHAGKVTTPGNYVRSDRAFTRYEMTTIYTTLPEGGGTQASRVRRPIPGRTLIWQFQESDGHYAEIQLDAPSLRYLIWENHSVTADWQDERFLVPIDKSIADTFSMTDREKLYSKALHFIFNSRVTQKVRWYQSGLFKSILMIAAVVITLYTAGTTWKAVAAAFAVGGISAAAMIIVTKIVTAFVLQEGFKLFVEEVGGELAFYLAMAAAIYGVASGFKAGSLKGAPWAEELLTASNGIASAIQSVQAELMEGLQQDYLKLLDDQALQLDDLNKAKSLLDTSSIINPFEFTRPTTMFIPGESPTDFYSRTIHAGNVGALSIAASLNYAEHALKLPKPSDTLGVTL